MDLFEQMVKRHGTYPVRTALGCITLAKTGVSEAELAHLLSLDDDVLADCYEWWVPPVRVVPPIVVSRLLEDLKMYLTTRGDGGGFPLVSWYHRQFWEAAETWLFPDDSFLGVSSNIRHRFVCSNLVCVAPGAGSPARTNARSDVAILRRGLE